MRDIRTVVREFILAECLPGEAPDHLKDDAALRAKGILDSMMMLALVHELEAASGIAIEAHELDDGNFDSVNAIVAFVERRRAG